MGGASTLPKAQELWGRGGGKTGRIRALSGDHKETVSPGHSREAAQVNSAVVTACTSLVQTQVKPNPLTERGGGHKAPTLAKEMVQLLGEEDSVWWWWWWFFNSVAPGKWTKPQWKATSWRIYAQHKLDFIGKKGKKNNGKTQRTQSLMEREGE